MVEYISGTLYSCDCGYRTLSKDCASKHSKTKKCILRTMVKKDMCFVSVSDYMAKNSPSSVNNTITAGDNSNISQTNITINLVVPEKSTLRSVQDAVKNPECISEIRAADPREIPAILFKYTRGTKAEQSFISYDSGKNIVRHRDGVTGGEVSKDLRKFRNEYLRESTDIFDDDYHIPYMSPSVIPSMKDMTDPVFDTGKKKEELINAAQVIKMCASGDHRTYKFPHTTKEFYTHVANNVDREIKMTS